MFGDWPLAVGDYFAQLLQDRDGELYRRGRLFARGLLKVARTWGVDIDNCVLEQRRPWTQQLAYLSDR